MCDWAQNPPWLTRRLVIPTLTGAQGKIAATARLVGQEQLPILNETAQMGSLIAQTGFSHLSKQPFPALLAYPNHPSDRAAFLITSRSHDWGVASATWFGHLPAVSQQPPL